MGNQLVRTAYMQPSSSPLSSSPSSSSSPQPLHGGCPVAHHPGSEAAGSPATSSSCPASSSNPHLPPHHPSIPSSSPSSSSSTRPLSGGCPMAQRPGGNSSTARSSSFSGSSPSSSSSSSSSSSFSDEPPSDVPDHLVSSNSSSSSSLSSPPPLAAGLLPEGEIVRGAPIPAAGRGNSDDGSHWVNPSANALYRALMRNHKPIEAVDALNVSSVHDAVTENTWKCIEEYEDLHKTKCPNPTLSRFYGMDGIYSHKARLLHWVSGNPYPFDRHDWIVDRCGSEVKYVIDYYSSESVDSHTGEVEVEYFIDARPEPTIPGLWDRSRVAWKKWKNGEKWF